MVRAVFIAGAILALARWTPDAASATITGPNGPLCPDRSGVVYTGDAGQDSYAWTITGNGIIVGPSDARSVTVTAGADCGSPFTLSLTTILNGDPSTASKTVLVRDDQGPSSLSTTLPPGWFPTTNALISAVLTNTEGFDLCSGTNVTISLNAYYPDPTIPCRYALDIRATDACGNFSIVTDFLPTTGNWVVDPDPPVLVGVPPDATYSCRADVPLIAPVTAVDACSGVRTVTANETESGTACDFTILRTWTATDACGHVATHTQRIRVVDLAPPIMLGCPNNAGYQCRSQVPPMPTVTAMDSCSGSRPVTATETESGTPCALFITRTWTATDACGNVATCVQTIGVVDTTAPLIQCPPSVSMTCADCNVDPSNTGTATATDNCSTATVTYSDQVVGTCPKVVTRMWTASDACGNTASCVQRITCGPQSVVTDTSLCTFDRNPQTPCREFRLVFTPDGYGGCFKLRASNPGQVVYNTFASGTPGQTLSLTLSIPYPFVTRRTNPVRAFDGATVSIDSRTGATCLTPGNSIPVTVASGALPVTLASYGGNAFYNVGVQVTVPASGVVYVSIRLDFGLKGTGGYGRDAQSNAIPGSCTSPATVPVLNGGTYRFSVSGAAQGSDTICNLNQFKRNSGVGGVCLRSSSDDPCSSGRVVLRNGSNQIVGTSSLDPDGFYMITYRHSGAAADYRVTFEFSGTQQTQTVTLRPDVLVQADFAAP